MDKLAGWHGPLDRVEEANELLMAMSLHALADDLAPGVPLVSSLGRLRRYGTALARTAESGGEEIRLRSDESRRAAAVTGT
jgi:hypothetical protein